MLFKSSDKLICVFCKLKHRVYLKKEVSFFDILLLLIVTGLMAYAIWGGPDLRSLLIFMSLIFALQVFLRMRYRESVKCPHCGFDPILYRQSPSRAALKVKAFLSQRQNDPQYMLRSQPRIEPIYLSRSQMKVLRASEEEQEALAAAGKPQVVSREIESTQELRF